MRTSSSYLTTPCACKYGGAYTGSGAFVLSLPYGLKWDGGKNDNKVISSNSPIKILIGTKFCIKAEDRGHIPLVVRARSC